MSWLCRDGCPGYVGMDVLAMWGWMSWLCRDGCPGYVGMDVLVM